MTSLDMGNCPISAADADFEEIEIISTNAPLATVPDETRTEAWDTENFRFAVAVAKAGYFLLLLIAILLLLMYFLRKRRRQSQGQD